MNNEEWKPITGWPYEVSSRGRVRRAQPGPRTRIGRLVKQRVNEGGYARVSLHRQDSSKTFFVHHLVAEAYLGARPKGRLCCHINGNQADNSADNLAWKTPEDNYLDRDRHGATAYGARHGRAKLTEEQVLDIRHDPRNSYQLARIYKVNPTTIQRIKNRKRYKIQAAAKAEEE